MKIAGFIDKLKKVEGYEVFTFWEKYFEGSCPCFGGTRTVDGKKIHVAGRCWRVSDSEDGQDLYIWGEHPKPILEKIGKEVKRALDETEWYNQYILIFQEF